VNTEERDPSISSVMQFSARCDRSARGSRALLYTYTRNGPHLSHLISIEPLGGERLHLTKTKINLALGSASANVRIARVLASLFDSRRRIWIQPPLSVFLYISPFYFSCRLSLSLSLSLYLSLSLCFANAPSDYYSPPPAASRRAHSRLGLARTRARHDIRAGCTRDLYFAGPSRTSPSDRRTNERTKQGGRNLRANVRAHSCERKLPRGSAG